MRALSTLVLALALALPATALVKIVEIRTVDPKLLDVQIVDEKGTERDAKTGDELKETDRIRTGYKSEAALDFDGKATVLVEELTEFKIGIFRLGDVREMELWLKVGGVQAQVSKIAAGRTLFSVKTPTVTASVRGTWKRITHTDQTGSTALVRGGSIETLLSGRARRRLRHGESVRQNRFGEWVDSWKNDERLARTYAIPDDLTADERRNLDRQPIVVQNAPDIYSGGMTQGVLPGQPPSSQQGGYWFQSLGTIFMNKMVSTDTYYQSAPPFPISAPGTFSSSAGPFVAGPMTIREISAGPIPNSGSNPPSGPYQPYIVSPPSSSSFTPFPSIPGSHFVSGFSLGGILPGGKVIPGGGAIFQQP